MTKRRLGKGLDALFQSYDHSQGDDGELNKQVTEIKIHSIDPNIDQPRKIFNEKSINELSKSILEHGVVQPIIVKPLGERFVIVAGERRWRAARAAGLEQIPALVRDLDEKEVLEISLIENLQREDLNPIDEAMGIESLLKEYGLTQEQVAQRLGKSRPAIANSLRLLNLPEEIKKLLAEESISVGNARALLGIESDKEKVEIANLIVEKGLSVRETEKLIRNLRKKEKTSRKTIEKPAFLIGLEEEMEEALGTKVTIQQGRKKSTIMIEYYSNEDLERIMGTLKGY